MEYCLRAINNLIPRPGLKDMFADLRRAGIDVYCATDCDAHSVTAYFAKAGIPMPEGQFDTLKWPGSESILALIEVHRPRDVCRPRPSCKT